MAKIAIIAGIVAYILLPLWIYGYGPLIAIPCVVVGLVLSGVAVRRKENTWMSLVAVAINIAVFFLVIIAAGPKLVDFATPLP